MPHANYLSDIRPQIAKLAECLGATVETDTDPAMARLTLDVQGYRARLFVNQAWNGKVTISIDNANVPHKAWNQYGKDPTPTISATLSRDPLALAKDIERHLLNPSADALRVNWGRACAWLDAQAAKARLIDDLAAEFPGLIAKREHDNAAHFHCSAGGVHLSGGIDTGDTLRLAHGSISGAATIRAFLAFCQTREAVK